MLVGREKSLTLPGIILGFLGHPARSLFTISTELPPEWLLREIEKTRITLKYMITGLRPENRTLYSLNIEEKW
jgi:hypothetical protein